MMRLFLILFVFLTSASLAGAETGHGLLHAKVNLSDQGSLQRGARTFVNYCLSCHSAAYMRFNRLGKDLGIDEQILKANLMFGTDKSGDTMTVNMSKDDAKQYFGVAPPDLSVISRSRGADWLYTYLMSFYLDDKRPLGVNNLVFKDIAMPHVLWELQGWQKPVYREGSGTDGSSIKEIDHLEPVRPDEQKTKEYAKTVGDLVNFLVYLGEPIKLKRYTIGSWVIIYLLVFLVIAYLLKKEYWKDIH
ncbi:MAG: cytochrome c1 [Gammaproteobacteria bacterium]